VSTAFRGCAWLLPRERSASRMRSRGDKHAGDAGSSELPTAISRPQRVCFASIAGSPRLPVSLSCFATEQDLFGSEAVNSQTQD
jgi:hypothetical protein